MMQRSSTYILLIVTGILLLSFSSSPPPGRTGGPGETTCATIGCHSGVNVTIHGHIQLNGLPATITPGLTYPVNVQLIIDRGNPLRGGFQMMALTDSDQNTMGFSNPGIGGALTENNGRSYFGHAPAQNFGGRDTLDYTVDWHLPENLLTDSVIFYGAANFANGNGSSSGDRIVTFREAFGIKQSQFSLEVTSQNPTCPDSSDGQISVLASGGSPPYSYLWSSGQMTPADTTLRAGIYTITVTDQQLSMDSVTIDISEARDPEVPVMTCFSDTLIINSCAPFSYPVPTALDNCGIASVRLFSGKGPNQSFEPGLHLEIYEAFDQVGNATRCTIIVNNKASVEVDLNVHPIACHDDSTGSVAAIIMGDNGPYELQLADSSLSIDRLPEGAHQLFITDQSGCTWEEEVRIERPDSLQLEVTEIHHPLSTTSGDGSIEVRVLGGTPPYSFNWRTEDEDFSNDQNLSLLFPGTYRLIVTDAAGCMIQSVSITLDAVTSIIDPVLSEKLVIWPNPATSILNITTEQLPRMKQGLIFDSRGTLVHSFGELATHVDLSKTLPGTYYLLLHLENGMYVGKRFIKLAD